MWHGQPRIPARVYHRLVVTRPSDERQRKVEEEAAELAKGTLSPDCAYASRSWPVSFRVSTDAGAGSWSPRQKIHAGWSSTAKPPPWCPAPPPAKSTATKPAPPITCQISP